MDEFEEIFNSIYSQQSGLNNSKPPAEDESGTAPSGTLERPMYELSEEDIFAYYEAQRKRSHPEAPSQSTAGAGESAPDEPEYDGIPSGGDQEDCSPQDVSDSGFSAEEPPVQESESRFDTYQDLDDLNGLDDFDEPDEGFSTQSFKEYLSSLFAAFMIKLRGGVPADATTSTGEEDGEDLGPELPFMAASKYYGGFYTTIRPRLKVCLVLLLVLLYLSVGLPVTGILKNLQISVCICMTIELAIMVYSLDVFTNGLMNIFRGRFGVDSLASISCIVTLLDGILVVTGKMAAHMPLCLISSLSLIGVLTASLLASRGIRKTLRVPAIGKRRFSVTGETGVTGKEITLLKSKLPTDGFLRRVEEEPFDEYIFRRIAPILLILSAAAAVLIAVLKSDLPDLLYIFSVVFCSSVPAAALLCYSLPFCIGSLRLFGYGGAIAGWSGLTDIGHSKNLIVTDRDLFPSKNVAIENVRIFADYSSDKVLSYACSMILESKCGLDVAFSNLAKENNCQILRVDNFECLSGGGFKGMIEGNSIVCGCPDLMRLLNIKIPSRLIEGTSVLLAINGVLYSIINIKYRPDPAVRRALVSLMNSNRHAIFATRDFNITPDMIHDCFDVATDGYDFPPYVERFPLSEAQPSGQSKVAGILCREGLGPLIALADTGRSLFVVTNVNTFITVIAAFLGLILSAATLYFGSSVSVLSIFLFQIICGLPVVILGLVSNSSR